MSEEIRDEKCKIKICVMCGKKYTWKDSRGELTCGKPCHKKYMSKIRIGKENPRFNEGYRQWQRKTKHIMICQKCGIKNKKLEVHHKDRNQRNNEIENLIKVCRRCHMLLDGRFKNLNYRNSDTGLCRGF